jgi:hypothetical protein
LHSGGSGDGALIQPSFRLLERRSGVSGDCFRAQRGGLWSKILNRQLPKARLFNAGLASTPQCQFCMAAAIVAAGGGAGAVDADSMPLGRLVHPCWSCMALEPLRSRLAPWQLLQEARRQIEAATAPGRSFDVTLWTRSLVPSLYASVTPPRSEATFVWVCQPSLGAFGGAV